MFKGLLTMFTRKCVRQIDRKLFLVWGAFLNKENQGKLGSLGRFVLKISSGKMIENCPKNISKNVLTSVSKTT